MLPGRKSYHVWIHILVIALAIALVYHHIINAPFLWDDEVMITGNRLIKGEISLKEIFTHGAFGGPMERSSFYRPLQILTYAIDYRVWGGFNESGFHLTSLLFHFLGCIFLLLILRRLSYSNLFSFLIVIVYAIHPIQIENVTYLSGRGDVLCHLLSILCVYFFTLIPYRKPKWLWITLSVFFYLLAAFTKENTILLPVALIFLMIWKNDVFAKSKKPVITGLSLLLLMMASYLFFRFMMLSNLETRSLSLIAQEPLAIRLYTLPASVINYFKLLLVPFHYHMEYHYLLRTPLSWQMVLFLIILIMAFLIYKKKLLPKRELIFYYAWFFVFLIPVLNIYPLAATLREHWVTFSSIAFFLIIGRIFQELKLMEWKYRKIPVFKIMFLLWLLYITSYTYIRNTHWSSAFTLYEHDVKYSKKSFILWNNLGVEYFRKNDLSNAERCFLRSANVCPPPGYAPTQNNLGVIYQNHQDFEKAIHYYYRAIELDNYLLAYYNLGAILTSQGKNPEAIEILEKGIQSYPWDRDILYFLGIAYFRQGNLQKADRIFTRLNSMYPGYKNSKELIKEIRNRMYRH